MLYTYLAMRENYCGFPIVDNDHFSTEIVSKIIFDMKRGKDADIDGLTVEHLQFSHPVLSVLLSKLFMLIVLSRCVPKGFKRVTLCLYLKLKIVVPKLCRPVTLEVLRSALHCLKSLSTV